MRWPRFIVSIGGLCTAVSVYADAMHLGLELALAHESNIGRAEYAQDEQDDLALLAEATVSRSIRLTANSGLVARGGVQLASQQRYDDLNRLSAQGALRYRIQPIPGFTMPWFDVALGGERLQHRDSDLRDSWRGNLSLGVGKYVTDKLRVSAGWLGERRYADEGRVFDLRNQGWQIGVDFKLSQQQALYVRADRIQGDQVSSAPQSSLSASPLLYEAKAPDQALSEHDRFRNAYRFDAITRSLEVGYNHTIRDNMGLDISARYFDADAEGGHTYEGYSARAGLLYRFQ